jgi:hypothetical protein
MSQKRPKFLDLYASIYGTLCSFLCICSYTTKLYKHYSHYCWLSTRSKKQFNSIVNVVYLKKKSDYEWNHLWTSPLVCLQFVLIAEVVRARTVLSFLLHQTLEQFRTNFAASKFASHRKIFANSDWILLTLIYQASLFCQKLFFRLSYRYSFFTISTVMLMFIILPCIVSITEFSFFKLMLQKNE